ncbi:uncharacterized protein MYCFIDRAFT_204783 [Pseudocercospora fijiensis CIRAD86]|uniref:Uncharacterized protein n=1 Tax=Pseudocercospora fijiensis (strain CIRAD86) TaxID=383855 RepID=M2ZJQ7_PSEFD|nr:uncharacterized protein MYCFIDRAFT_204783 [Pseudocercospora fijiensis CIRAD86]EME79329.1 hypothetical protein MYCFIDRAFT_204783 [Pseudocercospora fijiensis CIRAD86]
MRAASRMALEQDLWQLRWRQDVHRKPPSRPSQCGKHIAFEINNSLQCRLCIYTTLVPERITLFAPGRAQQRGLCMPPSRKLCMRLRDAGVLAPLGPAEQPTRILSAQSASNECYSLNSNTVQVYMQLTRPRVPHFEPKWFYSSLQRRIVNGSEKDDAELVKDVRS